MATPIKTHGLEDAIIKIGMSAERQMENAETAEEYAFLFGHVNMAAALAKTLHDGDGTLRISLNYEKASNAYHQAKAEVQEEINEEYHQMSMDELIPEIFEMLKTLTEKKTAPKKPSTMPKKSTKKE